MRNGQDIMDQAVVTRAVKARRHSGWPLALLASTALVAVPPALAPLGYGTAAFAAGGAGGYGDRSIYTQSGGVGGATSLSGTGGTGGDSESHGSSGPGGGGAGLGSGGPGGTALPATRPQGTGKGGTGGTHGARLPRGPAQAYTGTDGGDGNAADLGSGGGGEGGYGLILTGGPLPVTVDYNATGGKGGNGGDNKMFDTGSGGDGGIGLYIEGTGASVAVSNNVVITGGAGGKPGTAGALNANGMPQNGGKNGDNGVGGYGIYGNELTLTLGSGVVVTGGLAGDGTTRSPAVYFAGGSASANTIIIKDDTQTLTGGVGVAAGAAYTLSLTGTGGTFNSSKLAPNGVYGKASVVEFNSTGTWFVTGQDNATLSYGQRPAYSAVNLNGGTLQLGDASGIGALYGNVVIGHDTTLTNGTTVGTDRTGASVPAAVGDLSFGPAPGTGQKMGTLVLNQIPNHTSLTVDGTLMLSDGNGHPGNITLNLKAPSAYALVTVRTLDIDSTAVSALNIVDAGGLDEGTYRLVSSQSLGSNITDQTLTIGTAPAGLNYALDISPYGYGVELKVFDEGQYWNGTTTSGAGPLVGGSGTWQINTPADKNWADAPGTTHFGRDDTQTAVFSGTPGTVTVSNTNGAVKAKGLKFLASGYEITGDTLTLDNVYNRTPKITVVGSGTTATISSVVAGIQGINKLGAGTLILAGANTYTGDTLISAGTLQIGNGGTTGSIAANGSGSTDHVVIGAGSSLVFDRTDDITYSAITSGAGSFVKKGQNTLTLSSTNFVGPTNITVAQGTLLLNATNISYYNTIQPPTNLVIENGAVVSVDPNRTATVSGIKGQIDIRSGGVLRIYSNYTGLTQWDGGFATTSGSIIEAHLDAPSQTAMLEVANAGKVTFGGKINIVAENGFADGDFLIAQGDAFSYDITNLSVGKAPAHHGYSLVYVSARNSSSGLAELHLIAAPGQYWNGATTTAGGSAVAGGTGTWDVAAGTTNWTNAAGSIATAYGQNGYVVFGGTSGTVTVAAATAPEITGMEFVTSGFTVSGGDIVLKGVNGETSGRIYVEDAAVTGGGTATIASALTGTMGLEKAGLGTLVLTGANTYSGTTNVSSGTLQIGNGGTSGAIAGNLIDNGAVIFNRSDSVTVAGVVSGSGTLEQKGTGTLILTGANTFSGTTTVSSGTLRLSGGSLAGAVNVASGGTLTGDLTGATTATIGDAVSIASGATLGLVSGTTTLAIGGNLTIASGSTTAVTLLAPSTTAAATVAGDLALGGTLNLTAGTGIASGTYRLFTFAGNLSGNLTLGTLPAYSLAAIDTSTHNQVNLLVAAGQWWNGGGSLGGSGTWSPSAGTTNWGDSSGANPAAWGQGALAIFGGTAGTVTVGGTTAPQAVGLEFATTGYTVTGNGIELASFNGSATTAIKVEDSAATGGGTATIASVLSGTQGLDKTGTGTLVLTGANTYSGGTTISAGTLQVGDGGTAGSVVGNVVDNGALAFNRSDAVTYAGIISGTGTLDKQGTGTLALTGANTFTGGTTVTAGTLRLSGGGSLAGDVDVLSGATLAGDPAGGAAGTVAANVTVRNGGTLSAVSGGSAVGIDIGGNLSLASGASTAITLETPSNGKAAFAVAGNLGLDGTLNLVAGSAFNSGTYRLFDYAGTLSGGGLTLGATPAHSLFAVDTTTGNQVNLAVAAGLWWNGSTTTAGGSSVAGGAGTWDGAGSTTNWTNTAGSTANGWGQGSLGIFGGTAATVTVATTTVPQVAGLEFVTSGYTVTGGELALASFHGNTTTRILVEDTTVTGGGTATIASVLSSAQRLEKTGAGTLVLTGTNTYSGGTKITAGTLQIGDGGTAGEVVGDIGDQRLRLPQADAELRRPERLPRPDLQRAAVHRLRPDPQPVHPGGGGPEPRVRQPGVRGAADPARGAGGTGVRPAGRGGSRLAEHGDPAAVGVPAGRGGRAAAPVGLGGRCPGRGGPGHGSGDAGCGRRSRADAVGAGLWRVRPAAGQRQRRGDREFGRGDAGGPRRGVGRRDPGGCDGRPRPVERGRALAGHLGGVLDLRCRAVRQRPVRGFGGARGLRAELERGVGPAQRGVPGLLRLADGALHLGEAAGLRRGVDGRRRGLHHPSAVRGAVVCEPGRAPGAGAGLAGLGAVGDGARAGRGVHERGHAGGDAGDAGRRGADAERDAWLAARLRGSGATVDRRLRRGPGVRGERCARGGGHGAGGGRLGLRPVGRVGDPGELHRPARPEGDAERLHRGVLASVLGKTGTDCRGWHASDDLSSSSTFRRGGRGPEGPCPPLRLRA